MKKILALVLAALMMLSLAACGGNADVDPTTAPANGDTTAAADSDLAYIKSKGKMVIGITDYAPMNYPDENGAWTGFDTEFAEAVCAKLGVTPEFFVLADWDAKTNELNAKTIDCVWNGMTITDDLKDGYAFCYVKNIDDDFCSEFGTIAFKSIFGGVCRVN